MSRIAALEDHLRPHRFRVCNAAGQTLGTGFGIGRHVMTCAHVAGDTQLDELRILLDGVPVPVSGRIVSWQLDAMLLTMTSPTPRLAIGWERPDRVLIAGFPGESGLAGDLFVEASLGGSASISYEAGGHSYALPDIWTIPEGMVSPGFSGAPAIDCTNGAAAGMVVADFRTPAGKSGLSGFVLPLARLREDPDIGPILAGIAEEEPRYGGTPNAKGAEVWCRAASQRELARLADEQRYDSASVIARAEGEAEFERFLASEARIWAIVDRSGTGKSTLLARLVEASEYEPALLVRALDVDAAAGSLSDVVRQKLADTAPSHVSEAPTLEALGEASATAPLIALDGLNESGLAAADMRDKWLPDAVAQAARCKLILTCRPESWADISERIPKRLFHRPGEEDAKGGIDFRLGEFSGEERRKFLAAKFGGVPAALKGISNPLLLAMAAELSDDLPDHAVSRWSLLSRWTSHHCRHAAGKAQGFGARGVESLLEQIARECLRLGRETLPRSHELGRAPGFDALLGENLLVEEAGSFAFRYDLLFEHVAARGLDAADLRLTGGEWDYKGLPVGWPVVVAYCDQIADEDNQAAADLIWEKLAKADAQDDREGLSLLRALMALPMPATRVATARALIDTIAGTRPIALILMRGELASAGWPPGLLIPVLKHLVHASSGYDFRANDLAEIMRFTRNINQFEHDGFARLASVILQESRSEFLEALGAWHLDEEKLGAQRPDSARESSVASWTSFCFVSLAPRLTDDEMLTIPDPENGWYVFRGLAFVDPERLASFVELLEARVPFDAPRFISLARALRHAGEDLPAELRETVNDRVIETGLSRFASFDNDDFRNELLQWAAARPERRDAAWDLLVQLAEEGAAEADSFRHFLPHRPKEVVALVERLGDRIDYFTGSPQLELARTGPSFSGGVPDHVVAARVELLRGEAARLGYTKAARRGDPRRCRLGPPDSWRSGWGFHSRPSGTRAARSRIYS